MKIAVSHATAILGKRKIFLCGGKCNYDKNANEKIVQVFCIDKMLWDTLPPAPIKLCTAFFAQEKLTLLGGIECSINRLTNKLFTFLEHENKWENIYPAMDLARHRPGVVQHDNLLIVAGGKDGVTVHGTIEVLNVDTKQWFRPTFQLPSSMWIINFSIIRGFVYICGEDKNDNDPKPCAWRLPWSNFQNVARNDARNDPEKWENIKEEMPLTMPCLPFNNGTADRVIVIGGRDSKRTPQSDIYSYDPNRDEWLQVGALSVARLRMCAAHISKNLIFVAGGYTNPKKASETLKTAEIVCIQ